MRILAGKFTLKGRKKQKCAILVLLLVLASVVSFWNELRETVSSSGQIDQKKIAITFDDDVIIGLSQEISYKEAVSMI